MKGFDIDIDINKHKIGKYDDWVLFLDITGKSLLIADDGLHRTIKGTSLDEVKTKIDNHAKCSEAFRKRCKETLTDARKCEYCNYKFLCFTEKRKIEK